MKEQIGLDGVAKAPPPLPGEEMVQTVPPRPRDLVRAFSLWFEMVNMAEKVHRIRRRRQYLNEGTTQPGGIVEAVTRLKAQGLGLDEIRRLMIEIWIEPVFTAHPMESTRRTILRKQQKIAQLLLGRLGLSRTAAETRQIWDRIRSHRPAAVAARGPSVTLPT